MTRDGCVVGDVSLRIERGLEIGASVENGWGCLPGRKEVTRVRSHDHFQIVKTIDVDRLADLEIGDGRSRSKVRRGQMVELFGQDCSVGTSAWIR